MTAINLYVCIYSSQYILTQEEAAKLEDVDCITVLGASVTNGKPSPVLAGRIDTADDLFDKGVSNLFLLSGDNGSNYYNEVGAMKQYLLDESGGSVTSDNIYLDYAGFSTYDSMYRLQAIFGAKKTVVVTQKYHLYRSIFIARKLGIEAYGVPAKGGNYLGPRDEIRETLARIKCIGTVYGKAEPRFLGDKIELTYPSTSE
ncbi:MAG: YdcF family protein [Clostridiales Family XIII bacterium]|nr:YdcF family protein [Clostridiales Family XIII bacterium]